ncbi:MAG: tetratricopeptide repeat protein, partial [Parachlamydiaceae bacterium]|nr:tetratricopeptide repeat protein [Parachlamydiaceae bacterium]
MEFEKKFLIFEARAEFKKALFFQPNNKGYLEHTTWFLHNYSFYTEAIESFYNLLTVATDTDLRPIYQTLGWDLRKVGKLEESLSVFEAVFDFSWYNCSLRNSLAKISNDQSAENHNKISKLKSELPCKFNEFTAKKELFETCAYSRDFKCAIPLGRQLLLWDPTDFYLHYQYADILFKAGETEASIAEYIDLIEKVPDSAYAYLKLSEVYEMLGGLNEAESMLEIANALFKDPIIEAAYIRVLSKQGKTDLAFSIAEQIENSETDYLSSQLSLGEIYFYSRDYVNASSYFRAVLEEYPFNQDALWGLLKSSSHTRNSGDAHLSYERWSIVHFENDLQEQLAEYYRPFEILVPFEYFKNKNEFQRFGTGIILDFYARSNIRLSTGYYFTRFSQPHFSSIKRNSVFFEANKLFSESLQFRARALEHFYDNVASLKSDFDSSINSPKIFIANKIKSKSSFNYYLNIKYKFYKSSFASFSYDFYDIIDTEPPFGNSIYNYSNQIGAASLNIKTRDCNGFVFLSLSSRFYLFARFIYGKYSDGNRKESR